MKSVLLVSATTFILIFGGVAFVSRQVGNLTGPDPALQEQKTELEALRVRVAADQDAALRRQHAVRAQQAATAVQLELLKETTTHLAGLVSDIEKNRRTDDAARDEAATKLAKVYENMKPDRAAPILSALDMGTTLDILARMRERQTAKILSNMDPQRAAQISAELTAGGRL